MSEEIWDEKDQKKIEKILENLSSLYKDFLQNDIKGINRDAKRIRHFKQVIGEVEVIKKNLQINTYASARKPVCKGLNPQNWKDSFISSEKCGNILRFLLNYHSKFHWQYGYRNLPEELYQSFAYGEILGSMAPIATKSITLGFVLLSPNTEYPRHIHEGVDELYLNVGESCEINNCEVFHGESYHVISGLPHKIRSSKEEMAILLYTWIFPSENPGKYEMKFLK